MSITLALAYRNMWRRKNRTIAVITMIGICLSLLIFLSGLYEGMVVQMISSTLKGDMGHVTLFKQGYRTTESLNQLIYPQPEWEKLFQTLPDGTLALPRLKQEGMLSTARYSKGVTIIGIDPNKEPAPQLSALNTDEHAIVLGVGLAKKMKVVAHKKVILMAQSKDNEIVSEAFRVSDVIQTDNGDIDQNAAFITLKHFQHMLGVEGGVSYMAIMLPDSVPPEPIQHTLQEALPDDLTIDTWETLSSALKWMHDMLSTYNLMSFVIVFMVVFIGLFNIMLISVLERIKEFGILLAIGTKFKYITSLILLESLMISGIGLLLGCLGGIGLISMTAKTGIYFGAFATGLENFGFASTIYPSFNWDFITWSISAVFVTALLSSIWPIIVIKRLNPIESIQSQ